MVEAVRAYSHRSRRCPGAAGELAVANRTAADRDRLSDSLAQFWDAVNRTFALAADGNEAAARTQVSLSLQARQAALSTAVARLLIENNEAEEQAAQRVQAIYDQVQRQVYWFFAATLVVIAATGLYRDSRQQATLCRARDAVRRPP